MALFSDIDWMIVLAVGAFLLFGRDSGQVGRTLGRWYGRAVRLKEELLGELARAADLPMPAGGSAGSLRAALLGLDGGELSRSGVPAAVRTPPPAPLRPEPASPLPWTGGEPVTSWSSTSALDLAGSREVR